MQNRAAALSGAINSHIIDSFNWFLDTDISSVSCQMHTVIKERRDPAGTIRPVTSDDEANMLLRFADGEIATDATGLVSVSMTEGPKYENRIEFYGTDGSMRIGPLGELYLAKTGESDWIEIPVELGVTVAGVPDTGFARAFMAFAPKIIEALRSGENFVRTQQRSRTAFEFRKCSTPHAYRTLKNVQSRFFKFDI